MFSHQKAWISQSVHYLVNYKFCNGGVYPSLIHRGMKNIKKSCQKNILSYHYETLTLKNKKSTHQIDFNSTLWASWLFISTNLLFTLLTYFAHSILRFQSFSVLGGFPFSMKSQQMLIDNFPTTPQALNYLLLSIPKSQSLILFVCQWLWPCLYLELSSTSLN